MFTSGFASAKDMIDIMPLGSRGGPRSGNARSQLLRHDEDDEFSHGYGHQSIQGCQDTDYKNPR